MPNFGELSSDLSIPGSALANASVTSTKLASSVKNNALLGQASSTSVSLSDATERTVTGVANTNVVGTFSEWTSSWLSLGGSSPGGFLFVRFACEARVSSSSSSSSILLQTVRPDPQATGQGTYAGYVSNNSLFSIYEGVARTRWPLYSYWEPTNTASVLSTTYAPAVGAAFVPVIFPPGGSTQMRVAVATGYNSTATTYVRNLTASLHYIP